MKLQIIISALLLSTMAWSSEIGNDNGDFISDDKTYHISRPSNFSFLTSFGCGLPTDLSLEFATYYRLTDFFSTGLHSSFFSSSIKSVGTLQKNYYLIEDATLDYLGVTTSLALRFNIPFTEKRDFRSHYFEVNAGVRFTSSGSLSFECEDFSKTVSGENSDYISHWYNIETDLRLTNKAMGDVSFKYTALFEDVAGVSFTVGYLFSNIIDKTDFNTPVTLSSEWDKFNSYYQHPVVISNIAHFTHPLNRLYFRLQISLKIPVNKKGTRI